MATQLFANNAVSLLAADITNVQTTLAVTTAEGALFPSPSGGDWFYATLELGSLREIVQVTSRSGDTFTIVRGQDGTTALAWTAASNIKVELRANAAWFDRVHTEDNLPAAGLGDVNGPGSAVDDNVVFYDGTTGKLIKDSGITLSGSNTGDQIISDATISTTDITTNDFSTSKHGFVPKGTNVGNFLKDDGTWAAVDNTTPPDIVVNGSMNHWQSGVSFLTVANNAYLADQFKIQFVTGGTIDMSRIALNDTAIFTATGQLLQYGLRLDVNTIDASLAVGDFVTIQQPIEGSRALAYMHNEFTVSFYVRSNVTGTHTFSIRNIGLNRSYVKTYTIDVADTWERKTITIPVQDRSGTWNYTSDIGLLMGWCVMSGTTFEGTDDTWQTGDFVSVSGASNLMAVATNNFDLTGVQIDIGATAKPYRGIPAEVDLQTALRYYYNTMDTQGGIYPGFTTSEVEGAHSYGHFDADITHVFFTVRHPVEMRATPTITNYNYTDGTVGSWETTNGGGGNQTMTNANLSSKAASWGASGGTIAAGDFLTGHWQAVARM